MDQTALGNEVGQLQQKYSEAVNKSLQDLDARFLRKMQSFYFGSAKKCCDNDSLTMEQVQTCLERCERPVNNAQTLVQGELRQLQSRLEACAHECSQKSLDRLKTDDEMSESMRLLVQKDSLGCLSKCIDTQIGETIPATVARISSQLKKLHSEQKAASQ